MFAVLSLISGCSDSSSSGGGGLSLTEQYPTLAEHADMDEADFNTYLNYDLGDSSNPITIDQVKNMTIGARVLS